MAIRAAHLGGCMARLFFEDGRCLICGSHARPAQHTDPLPVPDHLRWAIDPDGSWLWMKTYPNSDLWFCSLKCFHRVVMPYITDTRHGPLDDYRNDAEYDHLCRLMLEANEQTGVLLEHLFIPGTKRHYERNRQAAIHRVNAWVDDWLAKQKKQTVDALVKFGKLCAVECGVYLKAIIEQQRERQRKEDEQMEREMERLVKEREREQAAAAREADRQRKEMERRAEREEEKRGREELIQKREAERAEEKQKRDEERRQKEEEKRRREEEERAAKEAEDKKWEPEDFTDFTGI